MTPIIEIALEEKAYRPGQSLRGKFGIDTAGNDLETLEFSVLWHTKGRGDEDLHVVHFAEWPDHEGTPFNCSEPYAFSVQLPRTPFSYDGALIKVCWCVRVRARWVDGDETIREEAFVLGNGT